MIYNLVLCSRHLGEIDVEYGLDGRPLRFIDKAYAEREAHERNVELINEHGSDCGIHWKVREE
jgi:hypothetical protein